MKIYSMTATFGKLSHETLTLKPGLNIIEAGNEWGKSTWCAFLVNMLYGIDTRARNTKEGLADKDRYLPWSGAPMSGRIELCWKGRDITIERATKGRLIFGDFRAFETATGIDIPELTATNCGQLLLGVERSVFMQAGFLKLTDLPVVQDDALRRRLNNLVTTGDESGAGDALATQLKNLKNKCRHNRTGLLPEAEAQQALLTAQLNELLELSQQETSLHQRQEQLERGIHALENHKAALRYAAAQEDLQKVAAADAALERARNDLADKQAATEGFASRDALLQQLHAAQALQDDLMVQQMQPQLLPPEKPELPDVYETLSAPEIIALAEKDCAENSRLEAGRKKRSAATTGIGIALLAVLAAAALPQLQPWLILAGAAALIGELIVILTGISASRRFYREQGVLFARHPNLSPDKWIADAHTHAARLEQYGSALAAYQNAAADRAAQRSALDEKITALAGESSLAQFMACCSAGMDTWDALEDARRELIRAEGYAKDLRSMAKPAERPTHPDTLTQTEEQTDQLLTAARFEQKQLQLKLGQSLGRREALGQEAAIRAQLKAVNRRISQLEDTYAALEHAQTALSAATTALQRRFAPRISKRTQELFGKLTGGRYQRITLGEDLSLSTSAGDEDVLRSSLYRSDGTIDQLYLALRLAVAEELTPDAPLVLDDALVRFDDQRLAVAVDILKEFSRSKQVILFTCQGRERTLIRETQNEGFATQIT